MSSLDDVSMDAFPSAIALGEAVVECMSEGMTYADIKEVVATAYFAYKPEESDD